MKIQCGAWNGQQCKATAKLTACVVTIHQGSILKGPEKAVIHLCPKHFQLENPRRKNRAEAERCQGESAGK